MASSSADPSSPKQVLRLARWAELERLGAARFPGTVGRIPNFVGAEAAAAHLVQSPQWQAARVIKCNPDSPQRPVRHAALKAGKIVVLALPRLAEARPFLVLDPAELPAGSLWAASSIKGSGGLGRAVSPEEVPPIDLIVAGCVAVDAHGARLGKGGGYSDLEYAILRELALVGPEVPIVSTVHDSQVLPPGLIPMAPHDTSLDLVATPSGLLRCDRRHARPHGVDWAILPAEKRAEIPVLEARWRRCDEPDDS